MAERIMTHPHNTADPSVRCRKQAKPEGKQKAGLPDQQGVCRRSLGALQQGLFMVHALQGRCILLALRLLHIKDIV